MSSSNLALATELDFANFYVKMYFSLQMCEDTETKMCPECDLYCDYWDLSFSCPLSRITYLFDNNITVLFSIFMTVWGKNVNLDF